MSNTDLFSLDKGFWAILENYEKLIIDQKKKAEE